MTHAAVGNGVGGRRTNRSGVAAYAAASTMGAGGVFADGESEMRVVGVCSPSPECRCSVLYQ